MVWQGNEKQVPSEPVFVPNPEAVGGDEDDGLVLSIVNDDGKDESFLLVLDGRCVREGRCPPPRPSYSPYCHRNQTEGPSRR